MLRLRITVNKENNQNPLNWEDEPRSITRQELVAQKRRMVEYAKKEYVNRGFMVVDFNQPPLSRNSFLVLEIPGPTIDTAKSLPELKSIVSAENGLQIQTPRIEVDWKLGNGVSLETCYIPESYLEMEIQEHNRTVGANGQ